MSSNLISSTKSMTVFIHFVENHQQWKKVMFNNPTLPNVFFPVRNFIGNRLMPVLQPCVSTASETTTGLFTLINCWHVLELDFYYGIFLSYFA